MAATELLRRLNERLGHRLNQRQYARVVKAELAPALARHLGSPRFGLPAEHEEWVRSRAEEMIALLEKAGYPVVGDLSELLPVSLPGARRPGDATTEELLDASVQALAELAERHAKAWWAARSPDSGVGAGPRRQRLASAARGAAFRGRRLGAEIADRNPWAERLMRVYLDARSAARGRAGRSGRRRD